MTPTVPPRPALFLDFDGTLVEIAPTPDSIVVPAGLPGLLETAAAAAGGALAVVSGRTIAEIDRYLAPARLPAAGQHGLERRLVVGGPVLTADPLPEIGEMRARLSASGLFGGGVFLEDKGLGFAVHYRAAPERADEVLAAVDAAAADYPAIHVIHGKMVAEAKQRGVDKGTAIAEFLAAPPFAGRTPVFIGDDVTDEDGFRAVAAAGGRAIKVGEGPTVAADRLADVPSVHAFLAALAASAETGR